MNEFPHKLDTWVEEEIDIPVIEPVLNEKQEVVGIKHTTRKATQKTMYTKAVETKVSCSDGSHDYFIPDRHNHVAHCKSCKKKRLVRAVYEKVIDGHVLDRYTGEIID